MSRRQYVDEEIIKKTVEPDMILGAHVAVLDFVFYTGKMFPAKYQNGAFICQHGSWNRSQRVGYNIVFVPFKNGKIARPKEDFLTGWLLDPGKREVWGRPMAACSSPTTAGTRFGAFPTRADRGRTFGQCRRGAEHTVFAPAAFGIETGLRDLPPIRWSGYAPAIRSGLHFLSC